MSKPEAATGAGVAQLGAHDATHGGVDATAPPQQRGRQLRERPPSIDPRVWRMAFARAVNTMGLSLVMTFLGIYIVKTRGYPASVYGLIALAANLAQSMANPWAGSLSDRIGRRPLITTALFVRSGFIALLGTQVLLGAPLWTLGATMVVSSTLRGCFEPVAHALVADVVREDQRVTAFGIQRMGINVGWALGPALGGALTLVVPYGAVFYLAAAGLVLAGVVTLGVEDPMRRTSHAASPTSGPTSGGDLRAALREVIADRTLRMLLLGALLCALLKTQMFSTFAIFMTEEIGLTEADVGLLYTCNGVGVLLLQVPALRLIRRLGIRTTLPWSSFLAGLGFALVGLASGFMGGALAILIVTAAEVVFDPAQQAAIVEVADPAHRGRSFGIVGFVSNVGIAVAPLLGGALFDVFGDHHAAMWLAIAAIGCGQTACFLAFVRRRTQVRPMNQAA